jgi:hypothetical protein
MNAIQDNNVEAGIARILEFSTFQHTPTTNRLVEAMLDQRPGPLPKKMKAEG